MLLRPTISLVRATHLPTRNASSLLRTSLSSEILLRCHHRSPPAFLLRQFTLTSRRVDRARNAVDGDDLIRLKLKGFEPEDHGGLPSKKISLRPLFFALGICLGSFCIADAVGWRSDVRFLQILAQTGWTSGDANAAKRRVESVERQQTLAWLQRIQAPGLIRQIYATGKDWWATQGDSQRAVITIIALNTLPFLAWRIPILGVQQFMQYSFINWPGITPSYTLLTSVFSHEVSLHLAHFQTRYEC
jgi:hypothetical protein